MSLNDDNHKQNVPNSEFFIHDRYVKRTLSRKSSFIAFLKFFAPKLHSILDLETLQLANSSFVDEKLRVSLSDLVYFAYTKGGTEILISIIFEHKSNPDPNLFFQLLDYVNNYWKQSLRQGKRLTPVAVIVFYHGLQPWRPKSIREQFRKLVDEPDILKMQPDFEPIFVDLNQVSEKDLLNLMDDVYLLIMLNLLKHIYKGPTEALRVVLFDILVVTKSEVSLKEALYEALLEGLKYLSQFRNFDYETAKELLMEAEVLQQYELELNEESPIAPFVKWLEDFWQKYQEAKKQAQEAERLAKEAKRQVFEAGYRLYKRGYALDDILEALSLDRDKFLEYISKREKENN